MGRFYKGDIEGKFWVGVQSSDDASNFGGYSYEPSYTVYDFTKDDMPDINAGIEKCKTRLGTYKKQMDSFFDSKQFYNDEELAKVLKVSMEEIRELLEVYARLGLGEKILKCVEEKGFCSFEAEY